LAGKAFALSDVMTACEKTETASLTTSNLNSCSRRATVSMTVALVVSVTLNVLLAHRVRSLVHQRSARVAEYQLKIGTTVPAITAQRLAGQQEIISYQETNQPTVLYIFTPGCLWCARNIESFKTLAKKESSQYRFIGISLSEQGLADYVAKNDLKLPIYSRLSAETLKTYKLGSTPETIVVSPESRVLEDWAGAYAGDQQSQVEAFFRISLPGLRTEPDAQKASRNIAAPTE